MSRRYESSGANYNTTNWRRLSVQKTIKLKITTTRKQVLTVSPPKVRAFCVACEGEVLTLTCVEAAEFLEIGEQNLAELIALGKVHAAKTVIGTFRICQGSLISD
jgi:hypothetical protein